MVVATAKLIMGPTRDHKVVKVRHDNLFRTWYWAACGYATCDDERIDNTTWEERPMCKRCEAKQ